MSAPVFSKKSHTWHFSQGRLNSMDFGRANGYYPNFHFKRENGKGKENQKPILQLLFEN